MFLLREGITPLILEQEEFPRFHIGESLTGEAAQVLRRLGLEEKMNEMENPVKHGVVVYGTNAATTWYVKVSSRDKEWNLYDNITWQVEKQLKELGDKVPERDRAPIQSAVDRVKEAAKGDDVNAINRSIDDLKNAAQAMAQFVQGHGGPGPDGGASMPGGGDGRGKDDVIDAEFEVKK